MPLLALLLTAILAMPDDLSQSTAGLKATDPIGRIAAAEHLLSLGPAAQAAAVPLVRAVGDQNEGVREAVTASLEELGAPAPADVPALARLLADDHGDIGYWAATLLGRLEGDAAGAVADLATVLRSSPHQAVRQRSAWALGKIGPRAAVALDALRQAADSDDPRLQRLAARAIEQIQRPQ